MPRSQPRRPQKKRSLGQSSPQNRGRIRSQSQNKSVSNTQGKIRKSNQLPEVYKTVILFSLLTYLSASLLWAINAPKEVVWVLILIPIPWIFVHIFPLEERYTKIAERLIFVFAATILVIVLGFSHQSVINLDNNPKIELIKELINKLFN